MKKFANKRVIKRTSFILIILVLMFNFITPNYSQADLGGELLKPISDFVIGIADALLGFLEKKLVGQSDLIDANGEAVDDADVRYSPGVIFSGGAPALSIDFLGVTDGGNNPPATPTPSDPPTKSGTYNQVLYEVLNLGYNYAGGPGGSTIVNPPNTKISNSIRNTFGTLPTLSLISMTSWGSNIDTGSYDNWVQELINDGCANDIKENGKTFSIDWDNSRYFELNNTQYLALGFQNKAMLSSTDEYILVIYASGVNQEKPLGPTDDPSENQMTSIAEQLAPFISKWYYTIRLFALVGLLSVLLYIGIRIVLGSTSAQNDAKYKKMLGDWLAAVCILFLLHYGMALMVKTTDMIIDFLGTEVMDGSGADQLMTSVRDTVKEDANNHFQVISGTVVYMALFVLTVIFTWQYLKRVVYVAFLTLIAPLIALTYPLDKIRDGKAQAFGMWLKEYMFNCLIQPVHLLLYTIFITAADTFVIDNPLYAIVAIGFLVPAEKFFKEMFGMSSKTSVGTLGAAAGGALAMSVLSKLGKKSSGKSGGGSSGGSSGSNGNNSSVRTANQGSNLYAGLPTSASGGSSGNSGGAGAPGGTGGASNSGGTSGTGSSGGTSGSSGAGSSGGTSGSSSTGGTSNSGTTVSSRPSGIAGAASAVRKKYVGNRDKTRKTAFNVARGAARIGLAGSGLMLGAGIGLATGDASKIFTYAGAGATAGNYAGKNLVDKAEGVTEKALKGDGAIRQGFSGLSEEEYANKQFDKEFFRGDEYESIRRDEKVMSNSRYQGPAGKANLKADTQTYLNAGITDTKKIRTAMAKGIDPNEAVGYITLASKVPKSATGNEEKFYNYVSKNASIGITDRTLSGQIWNSIQPFI